MLAAAAEGFGYSHGALSERQDMSECFLLMAVSVAYA